jgi:hypothetical protein
MAAAKSTLFSFLSLSFFLFSSGVVEASVSSATATTIEMHGSGTTNPSKYFWKAMDILEERAGKPVRMTYRAVGSGTGQTEFIGDDSDFGSADIPLSSTQHSGFASGTVVQVPFQLGAVSFFHNVAADDLHDSTTRETAVLSAAQRNICGTKVRIVPDELGLSRPRPDGSVRHSHRFPRSLFQNIHRLPEVLGRVGRARTVHFNRRRGSRRHGRLDNPRRKEEEREREEREKRGFRHRHSRALRLPLRIAHDAPGCV